MSATRPLARFFDDEIAFLSALGRMAGPGANDRLRLAIAEEVRQRRLSDARVTQLAKHYRMDLDALAEAYQELRDLA